MTKREYDKEYGQFRRAVRKRDRNRCQWPNCITNRDKVQVHHIKRWADQPLLRFREDNGICLCKLHHKSITGKEEQYLALFMRIVMNKKLAALAKQNREPAKREKRKGHIGRPLKMYKGKKREKPPE